MHQDRKSIIRQSNRQWVKACSVTWKNRLNPVKPCHPFHRTHAGWSSWAIEELVVEEGLYSNHHFRGETFGVLRSFDVKDGDYDDAILLEMRFALRSEELIDVFEDYRARRQDNGRPPFGYLDNQFFIESQLQSIKRQLTFSMEIIPGNIPDLELTEIVFGGISPLSLKDLRDPIRLRRWNPAKLTRRYFIPESLS